MIVATKTTELAAAAARLEGRWPGRGRDDRPERPRRRGRLPGRRVISAVTFMSGTRHSDTHVEYILDTETWLGPYGRRRTSSSRRSAASIVESGLKAQAFGTCAGAVVKLIFNATVNAVAALTGLPHDPHFAARER